MNIGRLVLNGFEQREAKAVAEALQRQLSQVLADQTTRSEWARPHRTPVVKLGRMTRHPGTTGADTFGRSLARAVGRRLMP